MSSPAQHVVRNANGGWDVKMIGADRASKHFKSQAEAIKWGKDVAIKKGIDLYIHDWDGKVSSKVSYKKGTIARNIPGRFKSQNRRRNFQPIEG